MGKRGNIETIPKKMQALDLLDKDFKTTFLNILKELKGSQRPNNNRNNV